MLVVDTSVLLAAADNADPDHEACTQAISAAGPLITTPLVIAETAYLIRRQLGADAEAALFRAVAAGELQVEPLTPAAGRRIADLIERYAAPSGSQSHELPRSTTVTSAPWDRATLRGTPTSG